MNMAPSLSPTAIAAAALAFMLAALLSEAQIEPPPVAPGPAADDCSTVLLGAADCLSYIEAGSNMTVPEKPCCGEIKSLVSNRPDCLCELLAKNNSLGIEFDTNKALKLPSVCSVSSPPISLCSLIGVPVSVVPVGTLPPPSSGSDASSLLSEELALVPVGAPFPTSGSDASPEQPPTLDTSSPPSPPPEENGSPSATPLTRSRKRSSVGLTVGVTVGGVVLLAAALALVTFLVRQRLRPMQRGEEGGLGPLTPEIASPSPFLESQSSVGSKIIKKGAGSTPREALKLSPLQAPKAPASPQFLQLPESQLNSKIYSMTSTSSSVSTGDRTSTEIFRARGRGALGDHPFGLPQAAALTGDQVQQHIVSVGIKTFTYQELSEATNDFSQDNFLGKGGFGSVYRGGFLADGRLVAIKQLKGGGFQGDREFLAEINVIGRVHHRNLVSLVGYCISGPERLLVYEYMQNNSLSFHLQGATPVLDWATRLSIALGAAKGISYLHEECYPRIIHRDIKSDNILLDSNFIPKVADFGLAKFVLDDKSHVSTRILGTLGYLAPEFGSTGRLTEKSDVFSFGVVLLELITGRKPINLTEWASTLLDQAMEDGKLETELIDPKLADNYDQEEMNRMVTCAAICVHRFPDNRPRMSQVVHVLEGNISPEKLKAETSRPRTRRLA